MMNTLGFYCKTSTISTTIWEAMLEERVTKINKKKKTITELKNVFDDLMIRLNMGEKRIGETEEINNFPN